MQKKNKKQHRLRTKHLLNSIRIWKGFFLSVDFKPEKLITPSYGQ